MSMTKTDYELVAGAIHSALSTWTPDTQERKSCIYAITDVALTIANELEADNPKFDRDKFLKLCGVEV